MGWGYSEKGIQSTMSNVQVSLVSLIHNLVSCTDEVTQKKLERVKLDGLTCFILAWKTN